MIVLYDQSIQTRYVLLFESYLLGVVQLPPTYNFTNDMFTAMEEEFGEVFATGYLVWLIAILFVISPDHGNTDLLVSILLCFVSAVVGGKLHIIVTQIAQHAYTQYRDELTPYEKKQSRLEKALSNLKGFAKMPNLGFRSMCATHQNQCSNFVDASMHSH